MSSILLPFARPLLASLGKKSGHLTRNSSGTRHLAKCGGCRPVDTVTFTSAQTCLQAFVGTWEMRPAYLVETPPTGCSYNCNSGLLSTAPEFSPYRICTPAMKYYADTINVAALVQTSGIICVRFAATWRTFYPDPNDVYALNGFFRSTDGGATFGSFRIDEAPDGCPSPSYTSDGPANGSDMTCAVVLT